MSWLLINFADNWADEFDIDGWFISESDVWEKFKNQPLREVGRMDGSFDIYFGTNECCSYKSLAHYLSHFHVKEISDSDAEVLIRLFNAQLREVEDKDGNKTECNPVKFT